ncbi:phosphoadenosine phosphosulfate reductase family protein [Halioxenophilus sp. WMMB6]|uniref:phosphoadenosine phosphosulfate reductase domain-containing protein n=1 Tax=Halioxenophilus sp. WMMB6 TaxID=3073815 RepID=UPI00295EBDA3|nr:phosphoadenosine phosphosulfate reductase family protein [Halioxenophilus sp. WMMB6]
MIDIDLNQVNASLRDARPEEILRWALSLDQKTIVTTNFGPFEAVLLNMVYEQAPGMPVICVDHGYNTTATYRFAADLTQRLGLNMHYYTPRVTAKRREAVMGGIPDIDDANEHDLFTKEVKLEPFARAMAEHQPQVWLTAIRKEQTAFRDSLDVVTVDGKTGVIKVAPVFYWTELDMEEYLYEKGLPNEEDYFDPTKVLKNRECGLHVG